MQHNTVSSFAVKLNARRQVSGIMRGFDQFMNIVLDKATDERDGSALGMVVRCVILRSFPPLMRPRLGCSLVAAFSVSN